MSNSNHVPGINGLQWHVGHIIRRLRLSGGRESQRDAARACGMSTGAYQRLEEHGGVTLAKLEKVAAHFSTTVSALHVYAGELNDAGGPSKSERNG